MSRRLLGGAVALLTTTVLIAGTITPAAADVPTAAPTPIPAATCAAFHGPNWRPASGSTDSRGALRVFAVQWEQQVDRVTDYATFRTAVRCTLQEQVVPHLRAGEPALVVFDEDIGLLTLAIGARGAAARAAATTPLRAPLRAGAPAPAGALSAIAQLEVAYAPQVAAYQSRFPGTNPVKALFLAATDTFVRAFSETFSDAARDYGVYLEANNNQAEYAESTAPADIATFADPELQPAPSAFVATSATVTNNAYLWGPQDVHPQAPPGERNLLLRNEKVPLTTFEADDLFLDNGPATGPEAVANLAPVTIGGFAVGVATSLPAFQFGPVSATPCADTSVTYMRCLNSLGTQVLLQPDANDGAWTGPAAQTDWQPLEWMGSAYRAVTDPSVGFAYAVNPMMTGNVYDIPFDGQSAILSRTPAAAGHYVGNTQVDPQDNAADAGYHGDLPHFLALAPWVVPDAPRASLRQTGDALAPGSGSALENAYVETALFADLVPAGTPVAAGKPTTAGTSRPGTSATGQVRRTTVPTPVRSALAATGGGAGVPAAGLVLLLLVITLRRRRVRRYPQGSRGR